MRKKEVNPGDKFNMLTVIEEVPPRNSGRYFKCLCDCGNVKEILLYHLVRSKTTSCGCYRSSIKTKHSMWESREYSTWENMVQRCTNPNSSKYHLYGGKGIKVCDQWLRSFSAFYGDVGPRPPGTSLDRLDPNKNYVKNNCRWATPREQLANLSRYRAKIKIDGRVMETEDWIKELGVDRELFKARVLKGLSFKEALLINVDIFVLEIESRQQTIYHLDRFLQKTAFYKDSVVKLLDEDHEEPYHGLIVRYLTGFKNWPEKYLVSKFAVKSTHLQREKSVKVKIPLPPICRNTDTKNSL